jgi:hypothetical protein
MLTNSIHRPSSQPKIFFYISISFSVLHMATFQKGCDQNSVNISAPSRFIFLEYSKWSCIK